MANKYIVRHGAVRFLGEYEAPAELPCGRGAEVVVRSPRGTEVGTVLCEATDRTRQLLSEPTEGQIIRSVSTDDQALLGRLRAMQEKEYDACRKYIDVRRLQMDLVDVEHLFGSERI